MKEHPILFSAPMVLALLEDRKTVTRRLSESWMKVRAGDGLWVRECFAHSYCMEDRGPVDQKLLHYRADLPADKSQAMTANHAFGLMKFKPSIHMPRWASRITLEATEDARRERLQDITEEDAVAEGCRADEDPYWKPTYHDPDSGGNPSAKRSYEFLWDSLHGKTGMYSWSANPMITRLAFRRIK